MARDGRNKLNYDTTTGRKPKFSVHFKIMIYWLKTSNFIRKPNENL